MQEFPDSAVLDVFRMCRLQVVLEKRGNQLTCLFKQITVGIAAKTHICVCV